MNQPAYPANLELREEPLTALAAHGAIPCAFRVERLIDLAALEGSPLASLAHQYHPAPFVKDYDAIAGNQPTDWPARFAIVRWTLIAAYRNSRRIGGAVVAVDSPSTCLLDGAADVAVLWDLRVHPASRGSGVGLALFQAAEKWAAARGCRQLKVETQDINVPACRLYAKAGCHLESVNHGLYPHLPSEVQLIWAKSLTSGS